MGKRRKGREVAFQLLYALELSGDSPDFVLSKYASFNRGFEEGVWDFAKILFEQAVNSSEIVNTQLEDVISNWSIERVSKIDRSILKLGCSEAIMNETPFNVIVDEMIELSKLFGDKDSPGFVNGVLDSWHKKYCC